MDTKETREGIARKEATLETRERVPLKQVTEEATSRLLHREAWVAAVSTLAATMTRATPEAPKEDRGVKTSARLPMAVTVQVLAPAVVRTKQGQHSGFIFVGREHCI